MSYPYTKPTPRYGYRRAWNDPNVGLVGSGPGRPLRRYATDPEVGLPQRGAGLGSSEASPVTSGIFNIGPAKGFSRGVFTPDPPWATPRYIASQPDGVNGLGGCCGMGAFGGFGADASTCDINALVSWVVSKLGNISPFASLPNLEVCVVGICTGINVKKEVLSALAKAMMGLGDVALNGIISAADSGLPTLKGYLATKIIPRLTKDVSSMMPSSVSKYVSVTDVLLINAFNSLADSLVSWVKSCKSGVAANIKSGFDANAITGNPEYCTYYGYTAIPLQPGEFGYDASNPQYKCGSGSSAQQQMTLVTMQQLDETMKTVDLSKMSTADLSKLTTVAAEQAKCASAGGDWYPGGADCLVDSYGQLYNCQAPTSATLKLNYCVPKGTAGAVSAAPSSSNLPLILGAGAAIVALLLLTR